MNIYCRKLFLSLSSLIIFLFLAGIFVNLSYADLYINILAVNGTDQEKEKEIKYYLPKELAKDDVLNTDELSLSYDVKKGAHYVFGNILLKPKQTRTFKILIRDVWQIDNDEIENIKEQMGRSLKRLEGSQYYDVGIVKQDGLLKRLDFVVKEQERFGDDIETRIDRYRVYQDEVDDIREKSLSVKYWRTKPPSVDESNIFTYVIEVDNPTDSELRTEDKKYYLPSEVKPEHLTNLQGFQVRYDLIKQQPYLALDEVLKPRELKRYEIGIIDIWNIDHVEIENLKDRTEHTYKLVEPTEYRESAEYLVASINKELEAIEYSQSIEKDIKDHIGAYKSNIKHYEKALHDLELLEGVLEAVRENLERSKVKNVLQRIRSLKSIAEIAASMFKKPSINKAWKIILGIMIFVGTYTFLHFTFWGKKSQTLKKEQEGKENEE